MILTPNSANIYGAVANTTGWMSNERFTFEFRTYVDGDPDVHWGPRTCTGNCTTQNYLNRPCGDIATLHTVSGYASAYNSKYFVDNSRSIPCN